MGSKTDLVKTIEQQQEKLGKYETRLRDVVHAYKSLMNEKEALEASLKALAVTKPAKKTENLENKPEEKKNDITAANNEEVAIAEDSLKSTNDEVENLQHQISTLTNALSTLTAEKTRMESSFQADKKRLRQEKEERDLKLEKEKIESANIHDELTKEFNELKMRIKAQQQERDKEESNHALMLRELQKLLSSERMSKEYLQEQFDETQARLKKSEKKLDKTVEYEKKLKEMSKELESLRERLQISEDIANTPSPLLIDLQSQMEEMKTQHIISFQRERLRADEAEKKLLCGVGTNEDRVAALELKLSDLSNLIGNYDRARMQDQQAIIKLKERVAQLEIENAMLAKAAKDITNSATKDLSEIDESHLTVQELINKISNLKALLNRANQRAEIPVNTDDVLKADFLNMIQSQIVAEPNHTQCQVELQKVKEEYEKYKSKTQTMLKSKIKDGDNMKEINSLTNQVSEMKDRISILRSQLENEKHSHERYVFGLKESFTHTENSLKKNIIETEEDCQLRIYSMEKQMQGQRERTMALLEEKDEELNNLKLSSNISRKERKLKHNDVATYNEKTGELEKGSDVISMLSNSERKIKSETQVLHYQQEIARQDVDIKSLRKARRELESSLREIQNVSLSKEEKYSDQVDELQAKLKRFELSHKESANLEYLKNVVVNFMCCTNADGKLHMLNAIAAVLHFTPKELLTVKHFNGMGS